MSVSCKVLDTTNCHNKEWRTFRLATQKEQVMSEDKKVKAVTYQYPTGHEVFWWPEFQAFAKRMMIDLDAPITKIVITLPVTEEGLVTVESHTNSLDRQNKT